MKRVLCVLRTSTQQQEVDSQRSDMLQYLEGLGYREEEIEWLEAQGASARSVNSQYLQMIDSIKSIILSSNGEITACACWHLNRLGRIESYLLSLKEWFLSNHIQVYIKEPSFQLLDSTGKPNSASELTWSMFATFVKLDTQEMMEKMKRGREESKRKGHYIGGRLPLGFKVSNKVIVPDPPKLDLVKTIYQEYSTKKYSYDKLLQELRERGIKLTFRHLQLTLTRELYAPYVGQELWDRVKKIREEGNISFSKSGKSQKALAQRMVKCAYCGATYLVDTGHYICMTKKTGHRTGKICESGKSIKIPVLDTVLWDYTEKVIIDHLYDKPSPEGIQEQEKQLNVLYKKIHTLEESKVKTKNKLLRAKTLYLDSDIGKAEYTKIKETVKGEEKARELTLEVHRKNVMEIKEKIDRLKHPDISGVIKSLIDIVQLGDPDMKRELCRENIRSIIVSRYFLIPKSREATLMEITDIYGSSLRVLYDHYADQHSKDFLKKLYILKNPETGEVEPYGSSFSESLKKKLVDLKIAAKGVDMWKSMMPEK